MLQVVRAIVPKIILDDVFTVSSSVPGDNVHVYVKTLLFPASRLWF